MSRPIVLLDVDGVLANFIERNMRELATIGVVRHHDDVTDFRLEHCLGLDDEQRRFMKSKWSEPGFAATMLPYAGAVDGVKQLREVADVYAVTAPMWSSPTWQHERQEWLVDLFGFERDQIVSTAAKYLVAGDVFVDDRADAVTKWYQWARVSGRGHTGYGVVWARPYNRDGNWIGMRTSDWSSVARLAATFIRPEPDFGGEAA